MPIEARDSGTDKTVQDVWVRDGSVDKAVQEVIINDSGTDKTVFTALTTTVLDNFEDGDVTDWNTEIGTNVFDAVSNSNTVSDTYSGRLRADDDFSRVSLNIGNSITPKVLSFKIRPFYNGFSNDATTFWIESSNTVQIMRIEFTGDGVIKGFDGATNAPVNVGTFSDGEIIAVDFNNIDFTNENYDLIIENSNKGTFDFTSSDNDILIFKYFLGTFNSGALHSSFLDDLEAQS